MRAPAGSTRRELKEIQEKYKDDKERLQREMMAFYQENKINPLASCWPLLLQLPVFLASTSCSTATRSRPRCSPEPAGELPLHPEPDREGRPAPSSSILIVLFIGTQLGAGLVMATRVQDRTSACIMFGLPLVVRPVHHHLPGRPRGLLDLDQRLDAGPAVGGEDVLPAAEAADAGGDRGREGGQPPPPPRKKKKRSSATVEAESETTTPTSCRRSPPARVEADPRAGRRRARPRRRGRRSPRSDDEIVGRIEGEDARPADRPPRPDDRRAAAALLPGRVPGRQDRKRVTVDAAGYRERRARGARAPGRARPPSGAAQTGREIELEPMSANERKRRPRPPQRPPGSRPTARATSPSAASSSPRWSAD